MDTELGNNSSKSTNTEDNNEKHRIVMLTTVDNPYDPLIQFHDWFAFDFQKGYDCCGYLDRVSKASSLFSDEVNEKLKEDAIDEIVRINVYGVYKKLIKYV